MRVDNIWSDRPTEPEQMKRTGEGCAAETRPVEFDLPDRGCRHLAQEPFTDAVRLSGSGERHDPAFVPTPGETARQVDRDALRAASVQASYYLDDLNAFPLTTDGGAAAIVVLLR